MALEPKELRRPTFGGHGYVQADTASDRFDGLFCCIMECRKEADFEIFGNLNNGIDNDTQACEGHVGALLGTPDYFDGQENTEWVVYPISEERKRQYRGKTGRADGIR